MFSSKNSGDFSFKSGTDITIPNFWKKEFSSNRSSVYVECSSDKTDKLILPESSKMPGSKSSKQQKKFSVEKEIFFSKRFCRQVYLSKFSAKLSRKFCSRSNCGKKKIFFRSNFFQETRSSGQLKCTFEHLAETFLPNFRRKFRL